SALTLQQGQTRELTGRIGGFTPESHPGTFTLKGQTSTPDIIVELPKTSVQAGENFVIRVRAKEGTPPNTFKAGVEALQEMN
ncbi:hypothetical protein R0J91_20385, partial [Micrococcus sp. SIMBA_131]